MKLIKLVNVKMPTIVGILTFISMVFPHMRDLTQEKTTVFFSILVFNRELEFQAHLR